MLTSVIGFFSGILSGMGVGGGMLLIPALRFFLDINQQSAQSINLFCFIPSALCALIVHMKKKNIDFRAALPIIITGVPFSLLGAFLCVNIPSKLLGRLFAVFILIFGIREIVTGIKSLKQRRKSTVS